MCSSIVNPKIYVYIMNFTKQSLYIIDYVYKSQFTVYLSFSNRESLSVSRLFSIIWGPKGAVKEDPRNIRPSMSGGHTEEPLIHCPSLPSGVVLTE